MTRTATLTVALSIAAALLAACNHWGHVDPVATHETRITDPDYTGYYQVLGAKHLQRREYRRAWTEYAALGDYAGLRSIIYQLAGDLDGFEAKLFDQMLAEYALGYQDQFQSENPIRQLERKLEETAAAMADSGSHVKSKVAWRVRRAVFDNLTPSDRRRYFATLERQQAEMAAAGDAQTAKFGREVAAELIEIRARHRWSAAEPAEPAPGG